jgi:hypothetical protein
MLSFSCTTKAQQTHCGPRQSTVDNSTELSHLQRLEFRGYLRPQLEGRYQQNTHHCLANVTQKREPAAFLEALRVRCCCFQRRTGTYVPRDIGGRCDTFIFITLYKILIDKDLFVLLSVVSGYSKWKLKREIHIQNHSSQNK